MAGYSLPAQATNQYLTKTSCSQTTASTKFTLTRKLTVANGNANTITITKDSSVNYIAAFGAGTAATSHTNNNRGGISATLSTTSNTQKSALNMAGILVGVGIFVAVGITIYLVCCRRHERVLEPIVLVVGNPNQKLPETQYTAPPPYHVSESVPRVYAIENQDN